MFRLGKHKPLSGVTNVDVARGGNRRCHPYFFLKKLTTLFCLSLSLFWLHTGVTPLEGVTPGPFLPVRPRLSTVLCKFSQPQFFNSVRVTPGGCHPGRSSHPSPSDATAITRCQLPSTVMSFMASGYFAGHSLAYYHIAYTAIARTSDWLFTSDRRFSREVNDSIRFDTANQLTFLLIK